LSCGTVKLRHSCSSAKPQRAELMTFWMFGICLDTLWQYCIVHCSRDGVWLQCYLLYLCAQAACLQSGIQEDVCTGSLLACWHTRGVGLVGWKDEGGANDISSAVI
jgi:hypothetical protein